MKSEILVYYKNEAPPAPEYYVIYHYLPATKEYSSSIALYHSGYSGNCSITWKYLPYGNAYYTGYYKCMGGFYDYDLLFLENGKWVKFKCLCRLSITKISRNSIISPSAFTALVEIMYMNMKI